MSEMEDFNRPVIEEFRSNAGKVSGMFEGAPLILLHHKGAKSGTDRVNPLMYQELGDGSLAIFASKGGAPTNPDWYHNLRANPDTKIEIGSEERPVHARIAQGDEADRIWSKQKETFPQFAGYEETAQGRAIPVVVLEPR